VCFVVLCVCCVLFPLSHILSTGDHASLNERRENVKRLQEGSDSKGATAPFAAHSVLSGSNKRGSSPADIELGGRSNDAGAVEAAEERPAKLTGMALLKAQYRAMLTKKYLHSLRHRKTFFALVLLPAVRGLCAMCVCVCDVCVCVCFCEL
jgi:hypothetical protein